MLTRMQGNRVLPPPPHIVDAVTMFGLTPVTPYCLALALKPKGLPGGT